MTLQATGERWRWPDLHDAQRAVLLDILIHGSRSRAELARRTGLSRTSLSRITRDLVELGFIVEGDTTPLPGRGRPSEQLLVRPEVATFAGIKLTGDTLYGAVTDFAATQLHVVETALPSRKVPDVVELIRLTVEELRQLYPRTVAVGICLAGDVSSATGDAHVIGSHFLGWDDVPLQRLVETATALPVSIANDVQALTVGHHWFGAGVGTRSMALIGFGAGIAAGLVINGEPVVGAHGHPGKVGHLPVSDDGPQCDRGHTGCVSAFVTIPAMLNASGQPTMDALLAAADRGDSRSTHALELAGFALGAVIAEITNLVDPERIIITGEGLPMVPRASEHLRLGIARFLDPAAESPSTELEPFAFTDYAWAAAIGAMRHIV